MAIGDTKKVTFQIVMEYTTIVEEYDEDYPLERQIALEKEYLETQGEDLLDALSNSLLKSVEITNISDN